MSPNRTHRFPEETLFHEDILGPIALSLSIKLSFSGIEGASAMGWYADRMPVLLYRTKNGKYVAKCLPFNQVGVGDSTLLALKSLAKALITIIDDAVSNDYLHRLTEDVNRGIGRPDDFYWKKYAEVAKHQAELTEIKRRELGLPDQTKIMNRAIITSQDPVALSTWRSMYRQHVGAC